MLKAVSELLAKILIKFVSLLNYFFQHSPAHPTAQYTLQQRSSENGLPFLLRDNEWKKEQHDAPPFKDLYESLDGSFVEGGRPLDILLAGLGPINECSAHTLLEVILDVEFSAYDLYRAIAEKLRKSGKEDTFLYLAQAEKYHMHLAAETFGAGSQKY